jgi:hypothetical protein
VELIPARSLVGFNSVQEGIIQTAGAANLQHDTHPEAPLTVRLKQESNQPSCKYIVQRFTSQFFLTQKKRANELTRQFRGNKNRLAKSPGSCCLSKTRTAEVWLHPGSPMGVI